MKICVFNYVFSLIYIYILDIVHIKYEVCMYVFI